MQLRKLRTYLFFLFFFIYAVCFAAEKRDLILHSKRHQPVSTGVPMPDVLINVAKKNKNLDSVDEAINPESRDYLIREGIDVSHYQGTIDWDKVAQNDNVGYVYIKATEGKELEDDMYEYNIDEARRVGLKVGSYHFFRGNVPVDEQLANMTSKIKREKQDLIPIVDVEHLNGVSPDEFVSRLKEFMAGVTRYYGHKPLLYTFVNFYNQYLQGAGFDEYKLMIAFYRDAQPELNNDHHYAIWQYSARGRILGIRGNVDKSKIMQGFTIADLRF